jgi:tetratricopeptide (TPR) repeat protein
LLRAGTSGKFDASRSFGCDEKGREAMDSSSTAHASNRSAGPGARLGRLWQLPLFLLSLALFGYAAYLFIDPKPGLTIDQKIDVARTLLKYDRPEAAIEQLNKLLGGEKLTLENESEIHLLLAQAIESGQKLKKLDLPINHEHIIEQSQLALNQGAKHEADIFRRMGESYEAIGNVDSALKNYRRAEAMDVNRALRLKRKVIDLQMSQGDSGAAEASLDDYLKDPKLSDSERAWALGEKSHILADSSKFIEARALLTEALRLNPDPTAQGQLHYWLGYSQWKLGDAGEAERLLRVSRDLMKVRHPTDADAAYALGRIRQDKGDFKEAKSFYESILISHPDAQVALLAKLGRGMCRISLGEDNPGLADLQTLTSEVLAKPARKKSIPEILIGLRDAATTLATRDNFQGALEVMSYEQSLMPTPPPGAFFARLATVYEKRADQVDASVESAPNPDEKFRRQSQGREFRTKAGDSYIAYAKSLNGGDEDKAYGDSIWKAVALYDQAGSLPLSIAALELYANERPDDGRAPEALLKLGRAYQAAGDFDKAITWLQRNQFRYPNSLAASKSGVPLAQAYMAKGPLSYPKAEATLKAVIQNNRLITPDADEFRQALFELAQLYYRTDRYEDSVIRLQEMTDRYPDDPRMAQLLFLMGDSNRKSAHLLKKQLAETAATQPAPPPEATLSAATQPADGRDTEAAAARAAAKKAEAENAIKERLTRAGTLYAKVIDRFRGGAPTSDLDKLYVKHSHFYRADCLYDLGNFKDAIKLYDAAALRYQDDPDALAALVQIVNGYCALGQLNDARTANERAKELLRKMPAKAFEQSGEGGMLMSKQYWEQLLKWTNDARMFGPESQVAGGQDNVRTSP